MLGVFINRLYEKHLPSCNPLLQLAVEKDVAVAFASGHNAIRAFDVKRPMGAAVNTLVNGTTPTISGHFLGEAEKFVKGSVCLTFPPFLSGLMAIHVYG